MSAARSCSRCSSSPFGEAASGSPTRPCAESRGPRETPKGRLIMSRIGKKAVAIPSGVTASVEGQTIKMKGPKGALELVLPNDVQAKLEKGSIKVVPRPETKRARSMWGTSGTLVSNLVAGVTKGFERKL